MFMPKFSHEKLLRKIKQRGNTPSGVSCSYLQWSPKFGLKMFSSKRERDHSHQGQVRAAKHGLAPQAGEKFHFEVLAVDSYAAPEPRMTKLYCFFTQTATGINRSVSWTTEKRLTEALGDIGIFHHDLHEGNVGKIGRKRVVIDFDTRSCSVHREPAKKKKKR